MHEENNTAGASEAAASLFHATYEAKGLGPLTLVWSDRGLRSIALPSVTREPTPAACAAIPARFQEPLDRYFDGVEVDLCDLPVDLAGTPFQRKVWEALRGIPHGAVRTYAAVAAAVGSPRAMRAVGMANARNPLPIVVPCHRVVEAGSRLGGYSGGLDVKRFLLRLEGAKLAGDVVLPRQLDLLG